MIPVVVVVVANAGSNVLVVMNAATSDASWSRAWDPKGFLEAATAPFARKSDPTWLKAAAAGGDGSPKLLRELKRQAQRARLREIHAERGFAQDHARPERDARFRDRRAGIRALRRGAGGRR